ncbi:MAG: molecular chaperone DnaJ [Gemmataceae bacterium]
MKRCYYEILSVEKSADEQAIRVAHRKLAMQYHPDRNPGDKEAELKFKEVSEAFEVLRDPQKKAVYDRYGHAGLDGQGGGGFGGTPGGMGDLFDILRGFMGGTGGRGRGGPRGGGDLTVELTLTLVEAYRGCRKEFTVPKVVRCDKCNATGMTAKSQRAVCRRCGGQGNLGLFGGACPQCRGRGVTISNPCGPCQGVGFVEARKDVAVDVPAGIDEGIVIQMQGSGHDGEPGAPSGDLQCIIRVRPHPLFQRDGQELQVEVPITFSQAALGGPLEVPTLEGKSINASVPRGAQTADEIRLTGHGMPHLRSGRRGDLVVRLKVATPRNLNKRQEELLRELGELEGTNPTAERKSWAERVFTFFASLGKTGDNPAPGDKKK